MFRHFSNNFIAWCFVVFFLSYYSMLTCLGQLGGQEALRAVHEEQSSR